MSRPASFRWPFHELDRALRDAGYESRPEQADALGIPERTLWRWKAEGVPDEGADRAALALGSHPSRIWDDWRPSVAKVLREARNATGKSLRAVASETGFAAGYIAQIERGERAPTLRVLRRYCPAINLPDPMELLAHWYWDVAESMQGKGVSKKSDGAGAEPEFESAPLRDDDLAC